MSLDSALLLFDLHHPVWDRKTLAMAGEDPAVLEELANCRLVEERDGGFVLTPSGVEEFLSLRDSFFLDSQPGRPLVDVRTWLRRNELELALKNAFAGRWGNKRTFPGARLSFLAPEVTPVFNPQGDLTGWSVSDYALPGALELDLLVLFDYDFICYMGSPRHPDDPEGVLNSDRILMAFADPCDLRRSVEELSAAHRWLMDRRGTLGPQFDLDVQGQDSVTWWAWVTGGEDEARAIHGALSPIGASLVGPSKPLDIWAFSLEALAGAGREETFFDLFDRVAHRIYASRAQA